MQSVCSCCLHKQLHQRSESELCTKTKAENIRRIIRATDQPQTKYKTTIGVRTAGHYGSAQQQVCP